VLKIYFIVQHDNMDEINIAKLSSFYTAASSIKAAGLVLPQNL